MRKTTMLVRNIQPKAPQPSLDLYPPKELANQYGWEDGDEMYLSLSGGLDWVGTVGIKKTNPPYLRRRLRRGGEQMSLSQWAREKGFENLDQLEFHFEPPNRFIYQDQTGSPVQVSNSGPRQSTPRAPRQRPSTPEVGKASSWRPEELTVILSALEAVERSIDVTAFFPAASVEASRFALDSPYAFLIATCLDRGTRSEIIWSIPFDLYLRLGHLDPQRVARMQREDLDAVIHQLPHRPRYIHTAADTIGELSQLIAGEYECDAAGLWQYRSAQAFKADLMGLTGVGPGLANMAVQLVLRAFGSVFAPSDTQELDIKSDVHTRRVLYRLGVADKASDDSALQAARRLKPESPGSLDAALWWVGHNWCHSKTPDCGECPMASVCPRVGVHQGKGGKGSETI